MENAGREIYSYFLLIARPIARNRLPRFGITEDREAIDWELIVPRNGIAIAVSSDVVICFTRSTWQADCTPILCR